LIWLVRTREIQSINVLQRECWYHSSPVLISYDLVLSEPSGCEATQFAVAATNHIVVGRVRSIYWTVGDLSFPCSNGNHRTQYPLLHRLRHMCIQRSDWSQPRRTEAFSTECNCTTHAFCSPDWPKVNKLCLKSNECCRKVLTIFSCTNPMYLQRRYKFIYGTADFV